MADDNISKLETLVHAAKLRLSECEEQDRKAMEGVIGFPRHRKDPCAALKEELAGLEDQLKRAAASASASGGSRPDASAKGPGSPPVKSSGPNPDASSVDSQGNTRPAVASPDGQFSISSSGPPDASSSVSGPHPPSATPEGVPTQTPDLAASTPESTPTPEPSVTPYPSQGPLPPDAPDVNVAPKADGPALYPGDPDAVPMSPQEQKEAEDLEHLQHILQNPYQEELEKQIERDNNTEAPGGAP